MCKQWVFWNICAGQPRGVHDGGQFQWSSLYTQLQTKKILLEPFFQLHDQELRPCLLGNSAYSIRSYLLKDFNLGNHIFRDQMRFDSSMSSSRVYIEYAFAALKNCWRILKAFDMAVDKCAMVTLALTILYNFCEFHKKLYMLQGIVGCTIILL